MYEAENIAGGYGAVPPRAVGGIEGLIGAAAPLPPAAIGEPPREKRRGFFRRLFGG